MRVLFLAHRLPYPPNKGDKIRSFRELEALARHHKVDLCCFYDDPLDRKHITGVQHYCDTVYAEFLPRIRSHLQSGIALVSGRDFTSAFFQSRSMFRQVKRALETREYDLIFVFGAAMTQYVRGVRHFPRILDMVDVDSDKWNQYGRYSRPPFSWVWQSEAARLARYERKIVRESALTLLCTAAEKDVLRRNLADGRVEVLENRMDTEYFDPGPISVPPEIEALRPYVIFTGSMDYFPNVDAVENFCREVFPLIRASVPNARLVIAGRSPAKAIRRLSRRAGVVVTGAVADIRPYLKGAAVAIAPMRVARGVQNKILEAMAMQLPVAVSSKAAVALPQPLREQVKVEDEPAKLAEYLVGVLTSPAVCGAGGRMALLSYAQEARWEEQWEELLSSTVCSHRRTAEKAVADVPLPWARKAG